MSLPTYAVLAGRVRTEIGAFGTPNAENTRKLLRRQFSQAVTRARADARVGAIATIRRAMPDDWKAAAFYLERTDPQSWGRSTRHEHSGPAGAPIGTEETAGAIDPRKLSREQRAALREILDAQTDRGED